MSPSSDATVCGVLGGPFFLTGQLASDKEHFHFHLCIVVAWLMEPCILAGLTVPGPLALWPG